MNTGICGGFSQIAEICERGQAQEFPQGGETPLWNIYRQERGRGGRRKGWSDLWYVVQVQARHELEVAKLCQERISRPGEEIFTMMAERKLRRKNGEWELVQEPAFQKYMFAETEDVQGLRIRLRQIVQMTKAIGVGDEIVPIYPEEENVLRMLGGSEHVIRLSHGFVEGERIVVMDGPLQGLEGLVKWSNFRQKMVGIGVSLFGRETVVRLGVELVRRVEGA